MKKVREFFNFRPVFLFAIGMCVGVFLGDVNLFLFLCLCAAALIAAVCFREKYTIVICIGIIFAMIRLLFVPSPVDLTDSPYIVRGTVYNISSDKIIIDDISLNGEQVSGKMRINKSGNYSIGDVIQVYTNVISANSALNRRALLSNGILYYSDNAEQITKTNEESNVHTFFASLRNDWANRIDIVFGKNAGIVKGMMLGDTSDVDFSDLNLLRSAGIAHILALSGLHVSIIAGFLTFIGKHTFGKRFATFCTPIVLAVYVAVVGFPVSFVRAFIAVVLQSAAILTARRYDSLVSLGLGAVVLLSVNPYIFFGASFILSFGSAFSIIMLSEPINGFFRDYRRRKHIKNYFRESLSVDIAASAGTLPLTASVFGNIPVFSVLANLFCIPLASLALLVAFLGCFSDLLYLDIANVAAAIVNCLLDAVRYVSLVCTSLPFSVIHVGKISAVFVILVFIAFFVLSDYFFISRKKKIITAISFVAFAALSLLF